MRQTFRAIIAVILLTVASSALFSTARVHAQAPDVGLVPGVPWNAIDDLGRKIANTKNAPELRKNRTVGLFYFLWMNPTTIIPQDKKNRPENDPAPYNIDTICKTIDPDPTQKDELLGSNGEMHFWGEPLFGYYDSRDPWVVRRHIQLIADAGVDVLIFDTTNAVTYPHVYLPLCDLLLKMREEGQTIPQVTFMTNTRVDLCVPQLWEDFYSKEQYKPLFFQWEGKPFLIANPKEVPDAFKDLFTFRSAYWPTNGNKITHDEWHWVAAYPQPYSWSKDKDTPEQVNVSTAQNLAQNKEAMPVWMSLGTARGRSFVWGAKKQKVDSDVGLNFAQQWTRAYELDPPFVMITGWNEWIAGRWYVPYHDSKTNTVTNIYAFVDQFNYEFSRDVEPNRASKYVDAYYLQMVDGIRKYKGVSATPQSAKWKSIDLTAGFEQWADVEPTLKDHINETIARNFDGVGGARYVNESGRNDLLYAKTTRDDQYVYVYVETREPIVPATPNGLCLMIDADRNLTTGWRGADLLIGREYREDGTTSAETYAKPKDKDSQAWSTKAKSFDVQWALDGNKIQFAIPVKLLKRGGNPKSLTFKILDNVPLNAPADLYDQGDVAPESSFFYAVEFTK